MNTNTDAGAGPVDQRVGLGTGWAYARHNCAEDWCGGFKTREQAVAALLDVYPEGGWVAQTRDVTEDDEDVQEGWTFLCMVGTYERVQPNTNNKKEQPHKAAGSELAQSLTTSQESVGGLRELYGDAYGETPPAPQAKPQQQPLTDEQIREAVNGAGMMFTAPDIKVARAIEAAHGINSVSE